VLEIVFFRDGEGRTFQADQSGKALQDRRDCSTFVCLRTDHGKGESEDSDRKCSSRKKMLYITAKNI